MFLILVSLFSFLGFIFYFFVIKPHNYWKKKNVNQMDLFDNLWFNWLAILKKQSAATLTMDLYKKFPEERFYGLHQFNKPGLLVKDLDLLKKIAIKDADHFTEHRFTLPAEADPIFEKNLISLRGQEWREMRAILSPTFTGSKMKILFNVISEYCAKFVDYFNENYHENELIEMQDVFTKFTNDVIASSVFGVEVNTLKNPENDFYIKGRAATNFLNPKKQIKFMLSIAAPKFYKFLNLRLFESDEIEFFTEVIKESIKTREEKGIVRKDMIHLLMEAKKDAEKINKNRESEGSLKKEISYQDIVAQSFIFFFGGFESVSRLMCFFAHELAVNPDVQEKLRKEIMETLENCDEQLTYESLMGMKYMDMVISETLRKYPTQVATDRVCTKPYTIEAVLPTEQDLTLEVGTGVVIPTYAIHHDPKYFPDPEKFDPERFNEKNKSKIENYAFQPFGLGPRSCIGNRFAIMETKIAIFYLLTRFEICPCEKTKIPMVLLRNAFSLSAEGGFWLKMKKIDRK